MKRFMSVLLALSAVVVISLIFRGFNDQVEYSARAEHPSGDHPKKDEHPAKTEHPSDEDSKKAEQTAKAEPTSDEDSKKAEHPAGTEHPSGEHPQ